MNYTSNRNNKKELPYKGEIITCLIGIVILFGITYGAIKYEQNNPTKIIENKYSYTSENGCVYKKQCIFDKVYIQGCAGTAIFLDDDGHPITCKKGEFK